MIPIIYEKDEAAFTSNGLGRLRDCIECKVVEERNSIYEADFSYPVDGANYDLIQIGRIIGVTHDESEDIQPFDIVSYSKPLDGVVTFHCTHISYRQSYLTTNGTGINRLVDAFARLSESTPTNPFAYLTDKDNSGYVAAFDGIPKTVRSFLGGVEGSILDAYGGEFEWDKWTVHLWESRGRQRDFTIRYGVNMLAYDQDYDNQGAYMSCVPYWTDGTAIVVGNKTNSNSSTITGRDECLPLDLSDKFEDAPTTAQLEATASAYMAANNTSLPMQNIHVEFVRLQDLGYEGFDSLLECKLCDTINVVFPDYNSSGRFKIVKTVWDVLRDRYESMELGELSVTLAEALGVEYGAITTTNVQPEWDSSNGYCKMPDGTLMQWSTTSINSLTTPVAMYTDFISTDYQVMVTLINNSNSATNITAISKTGTRSFSFGVNIIPSGGAHWFAIGRWK